MSFKKAFIFFLYFTANIVQAISIKNCALATLLANVWKSRSIQNQSCQKNNQKIVLGDRPAVVQEHVDDAFKHIKETRSWGYNGSEGWYRPLGLDDERIIKHSIMQTNNNDVYIIDVGCGQGAWARKAFDILQTEEYKNMGKKIHIFSVTGGKECENFIEHKDHVSLYQFNQFKIENIDEEFAKRGFDLKDKVNLIVSRWTLRHLTDTFGTVKRLYGLLQPEGKLLANGFLFKSATSKQIEGFPGVWENNENILANQNSNATLLFDEREAGRDEGGFLLMRNNNGGIDIPLEYAGQTQFIGANYQCASEAVTVYKKKFPESKFARTYLERRKKLYCGAQDVPCKKLYNFLKEKELFGNSRS